MNSFGTFLWHKLLLPRLDPDDENHTKLVRLYAWVYRIVKKAYEDNMTIEKARLDTRKALQDKGVVAEIDGMVYALLFEYAQRPKIHS